MFALDVLTVIAFRPMTGNGALTAKGLRVNLNAADQSPQRKSSQLFNNASMKATFLKDKDWVCFDPLIRHLSSRGWDYEWGGPLDFKEKMEGSNLLVVWNGQNEWQRPAVDLAKSRGVKIIYAELGFFPQFGNVFYDAMGIGPESSVMNDSLEWLTSDQLDDFREFQKHYVPKHDPHGYVLIPLQLESDTQIRKHSPFKLMQHFIDHCCEFFFESGMPLVFKRHPRDSSNYDTNGFPLVKHGDIRKIARHASLVYGINSTSLLECSMIQGLEVVAIGEGFLRKPEPRDHILAALLSLQVKQSADSLPHHLSARLGL